MPQCPRDRQLRRPFPEHFDILAGPYVHAARRGGAADKCDVLHDVEQPVGVSNASPELPQRTIENGVPEMPFNVRDETGVNALSSNDSTV
jgi:hypothetical protein